MYDKKHTKLIISLLICTLLLTALFFLTGATAYAATQDMQKLKQNTEVQIQKAQSEKEVREIYQKFEKQAASLDKVQSNTPAKHTSNYSSEQNKVSSTQKNAVTATQKESAASHEEKKAVNTASAKTEKTSINRKKTAARKKSSAVKTNNKSVKTAPVRKVKRNHPVRAEQKEMDFCPALVVISLFLAFAMVRLSIFGGSGIEITYITLSKKEVRKRK